MYERLFADRKWGAIVLIFPLAWSIGGPASNGNGGQTETRGYVNTDTGDGFEVGKPNACCSAISRRDAWRASCLAEIWNVVLERVVLMELRVRRDRDERREILTERLCHRRDYR